MNLLQRILAALAGVAGLVLAFVFASVVLAVAVTVGLLLWAWLWWRSRGLRAALDDELRARMGEGGDRPVEGAVIEGEFREVKSENAIGRSER